MLTIEILIGAVIFILFGLAIAFFGYQLFRLFLIAGGFILGFVATTNLLTIADQNTKLIVAILVGLIIALLANFIHTLGFVISSGFFAASAAALMIEQFSPTSDSLTKLAIIAFVGLFTALIVYIFNLKRILLIWITAFYGAYLIVRGILDIVQPGKGADLSALNPLVGILLLGVGILVAIMGARYQAKENKEE